jgi:hypothetical protein
MRTAWLAMSVALRMIASTAVTAAASGSVAATGRRMAGRTGKAVATHASASGIGADGHLDQPPPASSAAGAGFPGILFDIDGVFKHGGRWDPCGLACLQRCVAAGVPFAFVTNGGGGKTEAEYAAELQHKMAEAAAPAPSSSSGSDGNEVALDGSHMVLSYTPFGRHLAHLAPRPVLVVGDPADAVLAAAKAAGFARAVHVRDYALSHPTLNPFQQLPAGGPGGEAEAAVAAATRAFEEATRGEPFAAACVFTDPLDFFESLQVLVDRPGCGGAEEHAGALMV